MTKKINMRPSEWPKYMLVALVKSYEVAPGELSEPDFGMDAISIAIKAGILDKEVRNSKEIEEFRQGNQLVSFNGIQLVDVYETLNQMKKRGWISLKREQQSACWIPTPAGVDHAHSLMQPFYVKVGHSIVGDLKTIVVSAITALVVYFLLKLLS